MGESSPFPIVLLCSALMLDGLGHSFSFISSGTEMDVGQVAGALCRLPPGAAQNTCFAVGSCGASSVYRAIFFTGPLSPGSLMMMRRRRSPGVPCSVRDWGPQNCISVPEIRSVHADVEGNWPLVLLCLECRAQRQQWPWASSPGGKKNSANNRCSV